ncbi:MAG: hypothetical protein FVQ79_10075 [Planctomycetes bacterium]|nr:hypothetical protein [Planctomycetota bacterium]
MNKVDSNYFNNLIKQFESIRDTVHGDRQAIIKTFSAFNKDKDARITSFSKLINVFNSLLLALTFISKHLLRKDWWQANYSETIPEYDLLILVQEFESFSKMAFVQFLFSSVESSFRLFLRALDPEACKGGTAEFISIYECLFKSKLSACPHEGIEILELLRPVRNTIHNNGVYFHPSGRDVEVEWNGTKYRFIQGTPVDFVTWDFISSISDSLRTLLRTVVEDLSLIAVDQEITDPFVS